MGSQRRSSLGDFGVRTNMLPMHIAVEHDTPAPLLSALPCLGWLPCAPWQEKSFCGALVCLLLALALLVFLLYPLNHVFLHSPPILGFSSIRGVAHSRTFSLALSSAVNLSAEAIAALSSNTERLAKNPDPSVALMNTNIPERTLLGMQSPLVNRGTNQNFRIAAAKSMGVGLLLGLAYKIYCNIEISNRHAWYVSVHRKEPKDSME